MGPQSKRRKVAGQVEEINFDPAARHDFLTGFHKRKVARARHAQEVAEKRVQDIKRQERNKVSINGVLSHEKKIPNTHAHSSCYLAPQRTNDRVSTCRTRT